MADQQQKPAASRQAHQRAASEHGVRLEQTVLGSGERADTLKEANDKGFFGEKVDPTPNEHYTLPDPHTNPRPFTGPDVE